VDIGVSGGEFQQGHVEQFDCLLGRAVNQQFMYGPGLVVADKSGNRTEIGNGRMRATNLPTYASDAAAAADAGLLNGFFYTVAGGTLARIKGGTSELEQLRSEIEIDLASPGPIGATTPSTGTFTSVEVTDTTPSTSTTNGALAVAGGVGVAGAVNADRFNGITQSVVGTGLRFGFPSTAPVATGNAWIAQGINAALSNTIGNNWFAQGTSAGRSNTTGNNWIAQGTSAGRENTTGSGWIAQGFEAGYNRQGDNWWVVSNSRHYDFLYGDFAANNISLLRAGDDFNGGSGILKLPNAVSLPTGDPLLGGYLFVDAGALKYRGSAGTVTTIAPA
jgi:hypothetical protein